MSCKASKKEWGGGYYCDAKAGGCGTRFKPGSDECKALDELPTTKQENLDPADQFNTVNKIAQKRAYVGAVKGASAASEVFTADLEDGPPVEGVEPPRPPVTMPVETKAGKSAQPVGAEPPPGNTHTVTGPIEAVSVKESPPDAKKPWKKYGVKIGDNWYATFDEKVGAAAVKGVTVTIVYMTNAKGYHDIVALQPAGAATDTPEEQGDTHEGEPSTIEKIEIFWSEAGLPIGKLLTLLRKDKLIGEYDDLGKLAENKQAEVLAAIGVYASRCK
ncbi:MAG: hypothetical protein WC497_05460 [Patescibacteria group bacterium]